MSKVIVLGAGMVGRAMALDLAANHEVTSADVSESSLKPLREISLDEIFLEEIFAPAGS